MTKTKLKYEKPSMQVFELKKSPCCLLAAD